MYSSLPTSATSAIAEYVIARQRALARGSADRNIIWQYFGPKPPSFQMRPSPCPLPLSRGATGQRQYRFSPVSCSFTRASSISWWPATQRRLPGPNTLSMGLPAAGYVEKHLLASRLLVGNGSFDRCPAQYISCLSISVHLSFGLTRVK